MQSAHVTKGVGKCANCGTELRKAVLGGQCPACIVQIVCQTSANDGVADKLSSLRKPLTCADRVPLRYLGDYELLGEVGRGGMGVVYKARQLSLNRLVALKVIAPEQLASPRTIERFYTEVETVAKLDHPNIVPIYETGARDGCHYFSMKLIDGASLAVRVADLRLPISDSKSGLGTVRVCRITNLLANIADAIHYGHQRGILHRDIKPGNILIDSNDAPHVTDFGLAKLLEGNTSLTQSGEVLGTPAYMAPEQAAGRTSQITIAADVYSLGVILYELLAGRPPFARDTPIETLHATLYQEPLSPRSLNRSVPRDLETICLKCLEKEPAKRYRSSQEFSQDLRRFERGEPIQARAATQAERAWRWCQRKPALATTLAVLHVILILGVAGIFWQWRRALEEQFRARENLYASDINQAQLALTTDNLRQALDLLRRQIPKAGEPDLRGFEWRYLWRQCQSQELFSLSGHSEAVTSVEFSPDGRFLATASQDSKAKVWDVATHREIATLAGHTNDAQTVCFSPRGDLLVTGSQTDVRVWDGRTFQVLHTFPQRATKVRFSPGGQYLVAGGTNLTVWDTSHWNVVTTRELPPISEGAHPADSIDSGLAFSPDGRRIAVVLEEGVRLFTIPDLQDRELLRDQMPRTRFVEFSPDGRIVATCTLGHDVKLWEVEGCKELRSLSAHSDTVKGVAFSHDGKLIASASLDQTVKIWDVASGILVRTFRGHAEEVWGVAFSPRTNLLASVSKDGAVKFWNLSVEPSQAPDMKTFIPLGFSAAGDLMGFPGRGNLGAYDPATMERVSIAAFRGRRGDDESRVSLGNLSRNGMTMARQIVGRPEAEVWDLRNRHFVCSVESLGDVLLGPQAGLIATTTSNNTVTVWQLPEGVQRCVLPHATKPLVFAPDERILVTGEEGTSELKLWGVGPHHQHTAVLIRNLNVKGITSGVAAFSPDGRRLACSTWGGFVRLFDAHSGRELASLIGHKRDVSDISFSPDGRTLATISDDSTTRLWHLASGRELIRFQTPMKDPYGPHLRFSADGRSLVTVASEFTAMTTHVWYAPCFAEIAVAEGKDYRSGLVQGASDWYGVGMALERQGRASEAIRAFTEAIQSVSHLPGLEGIRQSALSQRARLFRQQGDFYEAGPDNCMALDLPPRDPHTRVQLLDLSAFFNRSLESEWSSIPILPYFTGLPQGITSLPGTNPIEFDIRGAIRLRNRDSEIDPSAVTGIPVRQECRHVHFLESAHFRESEDTPVGAYLIHYADGSQEEVPIRYGQHVRDWVLSVEPGEVRNGKVAWMGTNPSKGAIRIFEQTWHNPRPSVEIQSLDFVSKQTKCSPLLIAISVEP